MVNMLSGNENVEPKIVKIGSYSAKDLIPTINLEISNSYHSKLNGFNQD